MIITQGRLAFDYILASPRLRADKPAIFGLPYSALTRWTAGEVMQRLVDAGLAKVCSTRRDGSIAEIHATDLTIEQVEAVCLTEADIKRIDRWLKKGVR